MDVDEKREDEDKDVEMKDAEKEAEKEPTFEVLTNPCRVVPLQEAHIRYYAKGRVAMATRTVKEKNEAQKQTVAVTTRYTPVNPDRKSGFVLLQDLEPDEPEDILEFEGHE